MTRQILLIFLVSLGWVAADEGPQFVIAKAGVVELVCPTEETADDVEDGEVLGSGIPPTDTITWQRKVNNSEEFILIEQGDLFEMTDGNKILKSTGVEKEDVGQYRCLDGGVEVRVFEVTNVKFRVSMKKSYSVDVGSATSEEDLICKLSKGEGNEDVKVTYEWYERAEGTVSTGPDPGTKVCEDCPGRTVKLVDEGSQLSIENATMEDRKIFTCRAMAVDREVALCKEDPYCYEVETLLRVKDPLAAVYPFLGIVAEVLVLCVIIFFCERRREGKEDELDEDEGYNGNNTATSNSNIRQRK